MLLPQRLLSTWSSPGLKHTLKSLDHLPSLFQPSSSIRLRRGCSWSFITYQTLKWVQLVILLPLSPSLLCLPSKKPFSDQQHSGVDCDPSSVASPGARRWQNKSKPCSDPLPASHPFSLAHQGQRPCLPGESAIPHVTIPWHGRIFQTEQQRSF